MQITDIHKTISKIKGLDLTKYPTEEISRLLTGFGKVAVIEYKLHPGKKVLRARPEDHLWPYVTKAAHSYKPQEINQTFQRASTPNRTMFYGSIIPEDIDEGDLDNERVVVTTEASQWMRTKESCGVKKIAYSRWEVTEDIRMIAVLQNEDFLAASKHTQKIIADFNVFMEAYPQYRDSSMLVSNYIAREFGKEQTPSDYDYLISALYTEFITRKGFDGVLYPSVRMAGQGFNIAITPEAADNRMKLVAVGECTIYKRAFGNVIVDNDNELWINGKTDQPFQLTPVNPILHSGVDECLKHLGVNSIQELCTNKGYL